MHRLLPLIGVLALVLAGCDAVTSSPAPSPTPSPTPSPPASPAPTPTFDPAALDVGIVLAPPEAGASAAHGDAVRAAADALEGDDDANVRRIRVVDAPTEELRGDALAFLAGDGVDPVCTVGPAGGDHLLELADRHPETTFCLLGGELDGEVDNAFAVGLPRAEGAFLAGAAAALAAGDGPLGIVATTADPVPDELSEAFLAGVRHVRTPPEQDDADTPDDETPDEPDDEAAEDADDDGPAEVTTVTATGGPTSADVHAGVAEAAGTAYREDGLVAIVAYGGPSVLSGLVEAARASGGRVVGGWADVGVVVGEEALEVTAVSVATRFEALLAAALRHAEDPGDPPAPPGIADAVAVVPGGAVGTEDLVEELRGILDDLAEGRLTVPTPGDAS